ncbi:MAG: Glu-tRNA(Gln) amidotransferase subunit GatD [Candidatus Aenigmarchaeota archaeon]|nr:Glu-tRNA(Gln) amidotransferase subunit GatD [Candidatus Aenigmarchaeota archaeon]
MESLLKSKKIKIGDKISVINGKIQYAGILMPRIGLGDPSSLTIKLPNGYNIGVKYDKDVKIKLLERGKPIKFKPSTITVRKDPSKPTISILGAGGTIASRVEYKTGAVFPAFSPADLLLSFPELKDVANIKSRKLFDLLSEDMTPEHWKIIAKEVVKEIESGSKGVVIMHGTDTMHFTAAALSFMLRDLSVPVVLVGAQRSSDRGSSDNLVNLVCGATVAAESDIAEVVVVMHGNTTDDFCYVHHGTKVRKLHTSRRDAFRSINVRPLAKITYPDKKIEYMRTDYKKREDKKKVKLDDQMNSNVTLVYIYPGIKPEFINSLSSFDGVVLAVTGIGNVPANPTGDKFAQSIIPNIKNLIDSGIPVVIAPQTIHGRLDLNIYEAGRMLNATGVIGNYADWTPETALVKLMWVLGHTKDMNKIKEMMTTSYAGEISERTSVG